MSLFAAPNCSFLRAEGPSAVSAALAGAEVFTPSFTIFGSGTPGQEAFELSHTTGMRSGFAADRRVPDRRWISLEFTPGQWFGLSFAGRPADLSACIREPERYALRYVVRGSGNNADIELEDRRKSRHTLRFPAGWEIRVSSRSQAVAVPFTFLKERAPKGFDWSRVEEFRIGSAAEGWLQITDIEVVRFGDAKFVYAVGGHSLQGPGWRDRLPVYENYHGERPAVGTYFTTIMEPLAESEEQAGAYSDIVDRARALSAIGVIPAVTLEFRSWALMTDDKERMDAERRRFDAANAGGVQYDDFLKTFIRKKRVLDAVRLGQLDPLLRRIARKMSPLGPVYLRLFHEPYSFNPWGMREPADTKKFKEAWSHVAGIFREEGAGNVLFVVTFDIYDPGFAETDALPGSGVFAVELDGYTDRADRKNAELSANELYCGKLTELRWRIEKLYPSPSERPMLAVGECGFTGDHMAGKRDVYARFFRDLELRALGLGRVTFFYTDGARHPSPPQEGAWAVPWSMEEPWAGVLVKKLKDTVGFYSPAEFLNACYRIHVSSPAAVCE